MQQCTGSVGEQTIGHKQTIVLSIGGTILALYNDDQKYNINIAILSF